MLLSAVSILVVAQSSSEVPEGLMNNPVFVIRLKTYFCVLTAHLSAVTWLVCSLFRC